MTPEPILSDSAADMPDATPAPESTPASAAERDYAVYELPDHTPMKAVPDTMKLVALVAAESKDAARWAAVDTNPDLKARVEVKDGQSGEKVVLLAIALRSLGGAEPTFEEVQQVTARR